MVHAIGYPRVTPVNQDLWMQTQALIAAGCNKSTWTSSTGRHWIGPASSTRSAMRAPAICLVIWKLDRLGRSMKGIVELTGELFARGIDLRSLTGAIDTTTATGRKVFNILASIAEMERELVEERTIAGLAAARLRPGGGKGDRKSLLTPKKRETARKLLAAGDRPRDIAETIGVSLPTFYRHFPASERECAPDDRE